MAVVIKFFDKLEDEVRGYLSHRTIVYGFVVGVGIVLFWRGVWHTADFLVHLYVDWVPGIGADLVGTIWWDGPLSIVVGAAILLVSGTFVSEFIGKEIIISGLRREKKITELTEAEVEAESGEITEILKEVRALREEVRRK